MTNKIRYGMVGGNLNAFIGNVHRQAISYEAGTQLVAGCFSRDHGVNQECGQFYEIDSERIYNTYKDMADQESQRKDKIDFVSIVTPNNTHYDIAKIFIEKGINIVCEKPLCFTIEQAIELEELAQKNNVLFAITYTYTGYGMVKYAKKLVEDGAVGDIINVNAEYLQEWLIDDIQEGEETTNKLSIWRKDPKYAGISNCVGDIGSHIENTVAYMTGLKLKKVAAVLDKFNQELDLNANILVEFENGAHGVYSSSQVCIGHANGLVIRIFGTNGAIEWHQETPDYLYYTKKGEAMQKLVRGMGYVKGRAEELNRIPPGHPEGLFIAFANIYKTFIQAVCKKRDGVELMKEDLDFPKVSDGVDGVKFIHSVVTSNRNGSVWTEI